MNQTIHCGDRVRYTGTFLHDAGIYTGPLAFRQGTVESVSTTGLARVRWEDEPERVAHVRVGCLHVVGTPEHYR